MIQRYRLFAALLTGLLLTAGSLAQDAAVGMATAQGMIDKVEKESIVVRPRSADGKFEKSLNLKLTGTSKISTLSYQKRAGKNVAVQKDTEARDLTAKQPIAVIYTTGPDGLVLLAAVVLPTAGK